MKSALRWLADGSVPKRKVSSKLACKLFTSDLLLIIDVLKDKPSHDEILEVAGVYSLWLTWLAGNHPDRDERGQALLDWLFLIERMKRFAGEADDEEAQG
jgi:hypothetical protein